MENAGFSPSGLDPDSQQGMFASIIRFSEDAIISKTLYGIITSWNQAAELLFGYKAEEVMGQQIRLLIPNDRLDEEDHIISRILNGEYIGKFRTVRRHKLGHPLQVSLTISPIRNQQGEIIGAAKIARDIGTEVALEEKLMQKNLELQRSNLYKDEVIGILAHELRTPLTTLKACIQLARNNRENADKLIDKADEQVNHISVMLSDLLDVTKIQAGRLEIKSTIVDAHEFVSKAILIVQQSSPSHFIEYNTVASTAPVLADAARMEQVIINLLNNAVKYSSGAHKVITQLSISEGFVVISVRDFGLGIPPEELEKIWTKFYRVKAHRNRVKGLGMGLYICKQLVTAHSGKIWAESDGNTGTTFYLKMPLVETSLSL